jgi:fructokinase
MARRYAAIEGGGTSWVVAISEGRPDNIVEREVFQTGKPSETLGKIREWLKDRTFSGIGIATFG